MKSTNYIKIKDGQVEVLLDVLLYEEKGVNYAYAPALDLIGYGEDVEEAKASFNIVLEEYFKFALENHTLDADLQEHGWKETAVEQFGSPSFLDMLRSNKQLPHVVSHDYAKMSEKFSYSMVN